MLEVPEVPIVDTRVEDVFERLGHTRVGAQQKGVYPPRRKLFPDIGCPRKTEQCATEGRAVSTGPRAEAQIRWLMNEVVETLICRSRYIEGCHLSSCLVARRFLSQPQHSEKKAPQTTANQRLRDAPLRIPDPSEQPEWLFEEV